MSEQYEPRANIFVNKNKVEGSKQPDYRATLEISRAVVNDMVAQLASGSDVAKCEWSGWKKHSDNAGHYLSGQIKPLYKKPDDGQPQNSAIAENRAKPVQPTPASDDTIPF